MKLTTGLARAAIAFLIGLVLLVMGLQAWASTLDFLTHALPATAHVAGNGRYVDGKGNVSYCPILSFRTRTGRSLTVEGHNVCQDAPFGQGASMAIHYRSDRPSTVEVDGFAGTWFNPVIFTALGLLLTIVPLAYVRRKWRQAHPPAVTAVAPGGAAEAPALQWTAKIGKPLGADYIARALAQAAEMPGESEGYAARTLDQSLADYDATMGDVLGDPHDPRLRPALEGRIRLLYRHGDYWRAMADMKRFAEAYRGAADRDRWAFFYDIPGVWYLPHTEAMSSYAGGLLALFLGDDEEALRHLRRSVEIEPAYAPAHRVLGAVYRRLGDDDAAHRSEREAARLDPTSGRPLSSAVS